MKDPYIVKDVLEFSDFIKLKNKVLELWENDKTTYDKGFGRHQWAVWGNEIPEILLPIKDYHIKLTEFARKEFESSTLIPSWCMVAVYEGDQARLWKHKDDNACTYHINLTVASKIPWDFYVEDKKFTPMENDAVLCYGNEQEHWRESMPDKENNMVANVFFFYCEPDHWYFTEGPQYLYTNIRANNKEGM